MRKKGHNVKKNLITLDLLKFVRNSPIKPFKTYYYCPKITSPAGGDPGGPGVGSAGPVGGSAGPGSGGGAEKSVACSDSHANRPQQPRTFYKTFLGKKTGRIPMDWQERATPRGSLTF